MGVVWKAVDTTLDRDVAIKVLLPQVSAEPERLERFNREAKLLASLNHPNIATVHGFHEAEGVRFVVMEFVDGEDLSQRIARGALPLGEALEVATRIAVALTAAHDRGIVHRDLKPANVRVTADGTVKVLDFGLAKSLGEETSGSGSSPANSPTLTAGGTAFGVILGTAAYMSPEQARGKAVDRRTDLWAFGCVLYEMLTGKSAFLGETVTDTLSSVIGRDPDWSLLPPETPTATRRLLRRCLTKDAGLRLRDAADARLDLIESDVPETSGADPALPPRRSPLLVAVAALIGAALVGLAWFLSPAPPPAGPTDGLPLPRQATFTGEVVDPPAVGGASRTSVTGMDLSADGRTAVYITRDRAQAILIDLDGGGSQQLFRADDGTILYDVAWSPEGDRVYLMTWPYSERIFSVPRFGGEPRPEFDLGKLAGLNGIFGRPVGNRRWVFFGNHNTVYVGDDPASLSARGTQLVGEGVFRIEGLEMLERVVPSTGARFLVFDGVDAQGQPQSGVTDAAGNATLVPSWAGLMPVSWVNQDRELYLWQPTGADFGDLLRVTMNPATGQPESAPVLIYPRLEARSVQVSSDGTRLALRTGAEVTNVIEFTLDGSPTAADNPTRRRTSGTGEWKLHNVMADGTLVASLTRGQGWELFAIADDGNRRSLVRGDNSRVVDVGSHGGGQLAIPLSPMTAGLLIHDLDNNRSRTIPVPMALSSVAWSPDGTHIVGMTTNHADRIVVVNVEKGEASTVSLDCGEQCEFAYEGVVSGPDWPYFAVTSEVDTWILNAETGALRHLADNTWNILAWHDSFVYFSRGGGQTDSPWDVLFRVPAAGGREERLLDLPKLCERPLVDPIRQTALCDRDESRLDVWVVDGLEE